MSMVTQHRSPQVFVLVVCHDSGRLFTSLKMSV